MTAVAETPIPSEFKATFSEAEPTTKQLVIINWSGELDKLWPTLIMSSAAAA